MSACSHEGFKFKYMVTSETLGFKLQLSCCGKCHSLRPKKNNCLVVLHNFFWEGAGGKIFFFFRFFFKSKSKLHRIIASISPNKGSNQSTLPKKYLYTSLKPVLKCIQVENNNLKNIFKISKFSKKKKTFLEFWKLGAVYFCTVKTFFQFSKIRGGRWRTTKQLFFSALVRPKLILFNLQ